MQKEEYERCGRCLKGNYLLTSTFYLLASHPFLLREWYDYMKKTKVSILKQNILINSLRISHITIWIYSPVSFPQLLSNSPHLSSKPQFYVLFSRKKKKICPVQFVLNIYSQTIIELPQNIIELPEPHPLSKLTLFPEVIVTPQLGVALLISSWSHSTLEYSLIWSCLGLRRQAHLLWTHEFCGPVVCRRPCFTPKVESRFLTYRSIYEQIEANKVISLAWNSPFVKAELLKFN